MNRRNVWLLIAGAIVAVIAIVFYDANRNARWEAEHREVKVLPDLAVNDVSQIHITAPTAALTVARKDDLWRVAERRDYPADFSKVRDLLRTLWELKAVREVQVGPSQFERLQISPPGKGAASGTQVEAAGQGGKTLATLVIGKAVQGEPEAGVAGPSGRFVYNPANKDHAYVVSESFYGLEPLQVNQWLDKTFISAGEVDKVVRGDAPGNPGWAIARPDLKGPWVFVPDANGEKVKEEPANLLSHFSPTFNDVRPPDAPAAETGLDQPVRAELHTTDGFTYKLTIGKPGPDKTRYLTVQVDAQLPASRTPEPNEKPEDKKAKDDEFNKHLGELRERLEREKKFAGWVYEVPEYSVENLLKPRADLVNKPALTPTPAAPSAAPVPAVVPPTPLPIPAPPAPTPTEAAPVPTPMGTVPAPATLAPAPTPTLTAPVARPTEAMPTPTATAPVPTPAVPVATPTEAAPPTPAATAPTPAPTEAAPAPSPSATALAVPEVSPPESTPATGVQESTAPAPAPNEPEATPSAPPPGVESTPAPATPEPTVTESSSPAPTPGAPTPPPSAASPDASEGTPMATPAAPVAPSSPQAEPEQPKPEQSASPTP
jgi:Domain of unknown function (DUF4340)